MTLKDMIEARRKLVEEARAMNDKAKAEERELTAEEDKRYDAIFAEVGALKDKVQAAETEKAKQEARAAQLAAEEEALRQAPSDPGPQQGQRSNRDGGRSREGQATEMDTTVRRALSRLFCMERLSGDEYRALQVDSDTAGGYLRMPEQFNRELIKDVDDLVQIRGVARTFTLTDAGSLGTPTRSAKAASAAWGQEIVAPTADTSLVFGKRELKPHYASLEVDISRPLLRSASLSAEQIVREEIARDAGELQENAFMTGSGALRPLGLFTASAQGISTSRDVSTGNTTTSITFDGLKSARGTLKTQYRMNARWLFHRDAVTQIGKLQDGFGQYYWQPSTQIGQPDMLLGYPVLESEFAPNTFTTGLYVGMFADFSNYWIVDALTLDIQVADQLLARTNQIAFLARFEVDGAPVREEGFVRIKLT